MKALFQALKLVPAQSLKSISRLDLAAAASSLNVTSKVWPLLLVKAQRSADGSVDEKCRALFKEKGPPYHQLVLENRCKSFRKDGEKIILVFQQKSLHIYLDSRFYDFCKTLKMYFWTCIKNVALK